MYDTLFQQSAWFYWVISIAALLSFVGFIVACICSCRHNENKSEFLGLPGMVTMTRADNEIFDRQPTADYSEIIAIDAVDNGKRANSANRSLPDIPKDRNTVVGDNGLGSTTQEIIYEGAEIIGDPSELYATVQDKNVGKRNNDRGTRTISQESSSLQEDDSAYPYARLNTLNSTNDEHPYAQVQSVPKPEVNRQNSFRSTPTQLPEPTQVCSSSSLLQNPVAPPRTRRSSSHNSLLNLESSPDIQAANAITGGVQANQDLPYMTPPLLIPLPRLPQTQSNPPHFSGDSGDSKGYTSISVREPLANIIAQTKAAHQNRPRTDPHYATVSDDSDEMYAAIDEQEKIYTSGSETYAQIQPMIETHRIPQVVSIEPVSLQRPEETPIFSAPQPPSVDSLRHVAHAHSRQASSSSATSSIINPGSPKPEKRQANSPLPPPPPPPPPPLPPSDDDHEESQGNPENSIRKSLEDMYAKVMKKKRDSDESQKVLEISRASWSSHDSVEIQKKEERVGSVAEGFNMDSVEFAKVARIYELDRTPEFEGVEREMEDSLQLEESNYEMLRGREEGVNGVDVVPFYMVPFKHRQVSNASSEDPGYEKVRIRRRVDVDGDTDSEPNYESMPHDPEPNYASVCRPGDSDGENNYESVRHTDPNYESVRYMGAKGGDPGYERVSGREDDPNYEKIRKDLVECNDTDDEQYVQV